MAKKKKKTTYHMTVNYQKQDVSVTELKIKRALRNSKYIVGQYRHRIRLQEQICEAQNAVLKTCIGEEEIRQAQMLNSLKAIKEACRVSPSAKRAKRKK